MNIEHFAKSPSVILSAEKIIRDCNFMVDTGSSVNLIKQSILKDSSINNQDTLTPRGIPQTPYETQESIKLNLLNRELKFYVVDNNVAFPQDTILYFLYSIIPKNS